MTQPNESRGGFATLTKILPDIDKHLTTIETSLKELIDFYDLHTRRPAERGPADTVFGLKLMIGECRDGHRALSLLVEKKNEELINFRVFGPHILPTLLTTVKAEHLRARIPIRSLGQYKVLKGDPARLTALRAVPDRIVATWESMAKLCKWDVLERIQTPGQRQAMQKWNRWARPLTQQSGHGKTKKSS